MSEQSEIRNLLGPYVMGALGPQEEREVDEHLDGCEGCREEAKDLRLAHERLVDLANATETPPPEVKDRVVASMPRLETRRRIRPWMMAAAVLCGLVVLALAFSSGLSGLFTPETSTATLQPTELAPGAGGELRIERYSANTEAELEVWDLPRLHQGEYYELWFGKGEGRVSAGTFTVGEEDRVTCNMTVPAETVGGYQRVGITRERFPVEPRMDSAKAVLVGDLREL
ncbi:MAG: zf-HC2 domain-containing protein [Rubrobacter sp.]